MGLNSINGHIMRAMAIAGANELSRSRQEVDALNVFPVPDGDTGTNMSLTIISAAREAEKNSSKKISDVASVCASGALRGARGNSGVILSQLIRGFSKAVSGEEEADTMLLAQAFKKAAETAYKAVMKPKEGTILTVASSCAQAAQKASLDTDDVEEFFGYIVSEGEKTLALTTDMLPALKEANVVDAGGMGLLCILKGALNYLKGGKEEPLNEIGQVAPVTMPDFDALSSVKAEDIKFGYCTEFFILKKNATEEEIDDLRKYLLSMGDSLVLVADDDVIKVHVHSNHPGLVIEKALSLGALNGLKIDNMRIQHSSKIEFSRQEKEESKKAEENVFAPKNTEPKERGFISISSGEGFTDIFKNIGVDEIITGGQTMNPSTEDILKAIEKINAKTIFVLPNNKNIILASEQAAELTTDKKVIVVNTTSVPEGISAMLGYDESMSDDEVVDSMNESFDMVSTLSVTFAVRDTVVDGMKIKKDDYIGMLDHNITTVGKTVADCTKELMKKSVNDYAEVITVYYGEDTPKEDAESIADFARETFDGCEVELHYGGQPLYYYLISVE